MVLEGIVKDFLRSNKSPAEVDYDITIRLTILYCILCFYIIKLKAYNHRLYIYNTP